MTLSVDLLCNSYSLVDHLLHFSFTVLPGFRTSPYRFKAKEKKIVTSALIVFVVALVGEVVDSVLEVLVLRPKCLAL